MPLQHAAVDVEAGTGLMSDHKRDGLALVEIGDRIRRRSLR